MCVKVVFRLETGAKISHCFILKEQYRNKEKINGRWSANRKAVGGMVNNPCKIEKIKNKLLCIE